MKSFCTSKKMMSFILAVFLFISVISTIVPTAVFADFTGFNNLDFEKGSTNWNCYGDAKVVNHDGNFSPYSLQLGNDAGTNTAAGTYASQTVSCNPNTIYQIEIYGKASTANLQLNVSVNYYDVNWNLIAKDVSVVIPMTTAYQYFWKNPVSYHKSAALAAFMEIKFSKDTTAGRVYVDDIKVGQQLPPVKNTPTCNISEYMTPMWKSATQYNELVLMYSTNSGLATGKLLFTPTSKITVKSFDLNTTYVEGTDYTVNGNVITLTSNSRITFKKDTDFHPNTQEYLDDKNGHTSGILGKQIAVTYQHDIKWDGPALTYKGDMLPKTMNKLINKQPIKIAFLGDSITWGSDTSNTNQLAPYMPEWRDLVVDRLKAIYGYNDITGINVALPGQQTDTAASWANADIVPYKADLVVIAYGMNDFWSYDGSVSKAYYQKIMNDVKNSTTGNPNAEFILVSSMMFDPDYTYDTDYNSRMTTYEPMLYTLETTGVQVDPVYSISKYLHAQKKAKDVISNALHPNDYMARWYAQSLVQMIDNTGNTTPTWTSVNNTSFTYSGSNWWGNTAWTGCYGDDYNANAGNVTTDYAQYTFTGTQVKIYGPKANWLGKCDIYVDGVKKATVDEYSATNAMQQLYYDTGVLASGSHIIKIQATNTKNASASNVYIAVDRIDYINNPPTTWTNINNTSFTYSGSNWWGSTSWTGCYGDDYNANAGNVTTDYAQYTFTGTQAKVYAPKANWLGICDIYVDGVKKATVDGYSASLAVQQLYYDTGVLSNGTHTVKIMPTNTKNASASNVYIAVDYISYY